MSKCPPNAIIELHNRCGSSSVWMAGRQNTNDNETVKEGRREWWSILHSSPCAFCITQASGSVEWLARYLFPDRHNQLLRLWRTILIRETISQQPPQKRWRGESGGNCNFITKMIHFRIQNVRGSQAELVVNGRYFIGLRQWGGRIIFFLFCREIVIIIEDKLW